MASHDPPEILEKLIAAGCMPAVVDASFEIAAGEIFVIMGLSGSGKSTIVRCLSRLLEPTAGKILLDGQDLVALPQRELLEVRRHKMGMVFQHFGLLPHLTALENVAFPLKVQGYPETQRRDLAKRIISLVGLEGRENYLPRQLSGGQQQRVGIARSLVVEPELWFLDEPFSALDPLIRKQMQDEFLRLQRVLHKTIVFITHDFLEALRIADRVAIMKDGRIVQIGRPAELVLSPVDDYVRTFTADVPLGRILRAEDAMQPTNGMVPERSVIRHETLDTLIPMLCSFGEGRSVRVVDDSGQALGDLTLQSALSALAVAEHRRLPHSSNRTIQ